MARMVRTNVVIDEDLLDRVMSTFGLGSKRAAVDFALRTVAGADDPHAGMLALEGTGWAGDLGPMRRSRPDEIDRAPPR